MKISSKVMLSYHKYSCAIELDYSFNVIILTYQLAYSLYVMILTCSTLCLTIHMTYMSRSRAKLRWRLIMPSGVLKSFTCRLLGLGTRGDLGSFCVIGCGARVHGSRWIHFLLSDWGVGGSWWQPYSSLIIPHIWVGCRSLNHHMWLLADQYSVASRPILHLVLTLVM
jgi:hypothetical protein